MAVVCVSVSCSLNKFSYQSCVTNEECRETFGWGHVCEEETGLCGPATADIRCMDQPDQLRELFRMQKALNERIGVRTDEFNDEQKTEWVLNYCRAMSQELAELTDSVPWKWWAKYQKLDEQNARVEVVEEAEGVQWGLEDIKFEGCLHEN